MSEIVSEAFQLLYPNRDLGSYRFSLSYSGRFKDFGANVTHCMGKVDFKISKTWKGVNRNILIGLFHELFVKIFKTKNPETAFYSDLYNAFIKNVHLAVPKTKFAPALVESYDRINLKYFFGILEKPNLVWGKKTKYRLGSYDFHTDTITVSRVFVDKDLELLDYVMYHEMLHKYLKFKTKNGKNRFHDKRFRYAEKQFENAKIIEKKLRYL